MLPEKPTVQTILTRDLSRSDACAIGELIVRVWPKRGMTVERRADILQTDRSDTDATEDVASRSLIVRDGDRVVGHAQVFPRTIGTSHGNMAIAALSLVCTDPEYRGRNLGEMLVRKAWSAVDDGVLAFSLFQTSERARRFYARLGCGVVENRIVDSTSDDPTRCPFKDDLVMRYPGEREGWPTGEIDLSGPGY